MLTSSRRPKVQGSSWGSSSPADRALEGMVGNSPKEPRDPERKVSLFHLNVTEWGDTIEGLIELGEHSVYCFSEHHLTAVECERVKKRLLKSGWASVFNPASDSCRHRRRPARHPPASASELGGKKEQEAQCKKRQFIAELVDEVEEPQHRMDEDPDEKEVLDKTQTKRSRTSAGVAVAWKASMKIEEIRDLGFCGEDKSRIVGVILRVKGVSILVFEVYLWTGEGLKQKTYRFYSKWLKLLGLGDYLLLS